MKVADFDFDLPPHLIAQHPIEPRDAARLLEIGPGPQRDGTVAELPRMLRRGDLLVLNDTRVIKARLHGRRGDAAIEATLHKRVDDATWRAFARPAKKLKPGDRIVWAPDFQAEVLEKGEGGEVTLGFSCAGPALMAALGCHGQMPLPPYIRRAKDGDPHDDADYQTIWARREGAVAAPTAGLHFTPGLLDALDRAGVERVAITLHVGAGTFLPVKVEDTADHVMHAEIAEVSADAAAQLGQGRARGGRVVAVGTTVIRTLESAADAAGMVRPFSGETRLFITPGYRFRTADLLLTNFHLPRSTLFMLAAAFAGLDRIRAAYAHAIREGYRFYSYGDCCLLHRAGETA